MPVRSPTPATVLAALVLSTPACRTDDSVRPADVVVEAAAEPAPSDAVPPAPEPTPPPPAAAAPEPSAPPAETTDADDLAGWTVATTEEGRFEVAWHAAGGDVPRNRPFEMEILVRRDGAPVEGATVAVRGWMPDHGHGMVREPIVTEVGDGRHRVEGMLLHMRGEWDLMIDVTKDGAADTARFTLEL